VSGLIERPVRVEAREQHWTARKAAAARLILEDGTIYEGRSFGARRSSAGEVVFNTGMVGYPETLTDPSYRGQIITFTFPLIGNYGVPAPDSDLMTGSFESERIHAAGAIVADYSPRHSHWTAARSLSDWLIEQGIPGVTGIDTRSLTQRLRERGTMLGKIEFDGDPVELHDPNKDNLVAQASIEKPVLYAPPGRSKALGRVLLFDCGAKHSIIRCLVARGLEVLRVPWDFDVSEEKFDGLMISNGPGDPTMCTATVEQVRACLNRGIPTFGICLGNQLLALAIGAKTYKLKYGHRGQNQPVIECGTSRAIVTSQNHGFAVDESTLPRDWRPWFTNLNDGTNEGLRHAWGPFRSVQFHPEATPGPTDAAFLFDEFVRMLGPGGGR